MNNCYVVLEGERPVQVFFDAEEAYFYKEKLLNMNEERTKEEYGIEDDAAAAYQNGYDGGFVEVVSIDLDSIPEDQEEYTVNTSTGDVDIWMEDIYRLIDKGNEKL